MEEVLKVNGSQERNITLTNLRPYTTYKLQISIISLDGSQHIQLGPRSIAKRFFTLEDGKIPAYHSFSFPISYSPLSIPYRSN